MLKQKTERYTISAALKVTAGRREEYTSIWRG